MYGRYEPELDDQYLEEFDAWIDDVNELSEEVYQAIKKHGLMISLVRVYTDYPRFSSAHATVLEEMTEWSIDHKDHQNGELLDAMFNESKRDKLLSEFCFDYAVKSLSKGFD